MGEGWHARFGEAHAEVQALCAVTAQGFDAHGATAYVSLEPCRHEGKTPPCTHALQAAGVTRVIYGAADPGAASGGGGQVLREAGLDVIGPVFSTDEARRENPAFFPRQSGRPWVVLKLARTADGWIAEKRGQRTPISGVEAGLRVQQLRAGVDGIWIGGQTARVDDPLLTPRTVPPPRRSPARILMDRTLALPPSLRLFHEGEGPVIRVHGAAYSGGRATGIRGDVSISTLALDEVDGRLPLGQLLCELWTQGFRALLCEGGGVLGKALLESDLVDRLVLITTKARGWVDAVPAFPGYKADWTPNLVDWAPIEGPEVLDSGDQWEVWDRMGTDNPLPQREE